MPDDVKEMNQTPTEPVASETQSDLGSALADISSELFGQGSEEGGSGPTEEGKTDAPAKPSADDASASPQPGEGEEQLNSEAVQAVGAPKTWTKEALEKWAAVDPVVQQEILKREEDMFRGLEEYKGRAEVGDAYTKVVEPFKPVLEKLQINPVDLFGNFAANHYTLSFGNEQQKLQLAAGLLENYQIDLIKLAQYIGDRPAPDSVEAKLDRLLAQQNQPQRQPAQQPSGPTPDQRNAVQQQIDAFAADPKNIYFTEVANDIVALLNAGAANSLQEAYDKAVYANPVTRQKEIDRLTAEKLSENAKAEEERKRKIAESTAADVKTRESARDGTVPLGSMDDTLNETLASIKNRS